MKVKTVWRPNLNTELCKTGQSIRFSDSSSRFQPPFHCVNPPWPRIFLSLAFPWSSALSRPTSSSFSHRLSECLNVSSLSSLPCHLFHSPSLSPALFAVTLPESLPSSCKSWCFCELTNLRIHMSLSEVCSVCRLTNRRDRIGLEEARHGCCLQRPKSCLPPTEHRPDL
jgi:hypothetical protein